MNIKTLEYIHNLLIEEKRKAYEVYENARHLEYEYAEREADEDLIKQQREAADGYRDAYLVAEYALDDFERCDWGTGAWK